MKIPSTTFSFDSIGHLVQTILAVLLLVVLFGVSVWIVLPFLPATLWAGMLVVATWPTLLELQKRLGGRRTWAALLLVAGFLMFFVLPALLTIFSVLQQGPRLLDYFRDFIESETTPPAPAWLLNLPWLGTSMAGHWDNLWSESPAELFQRAQPHIGTASRWLLGVAGSIFWTLLNFLLTLLISFILFLKGESVAEAILRFARRAAGDRGESTIILASKAIRAVALGIVITAFIQAAAGGLGLWICGVPYAFLLTALMFLLGVAQLGAGPVMFSATLWMFFQDRLPWAIGLLVWSVFVTSIDNIIRPFLIKRGADLPLLLLFAGVIGGLFAFGIIGIFIGPVFLAVAYTVLSEWIRPSTPAPESSADAAPEKL